MSGRLCLLVDIQLGDITGVELARQLTAEGYKFPVIFMTGQERCGGRTQSHCRGWRRVLRKPFPATTLMDAIKKADG